VTPFERSRAVFNNYAGINEPFLPSSEMSAAQVLLSRWVNQKVKHTLPGSVENVLGATEELGELMEAGREIAIRLGKLSHLELNLSQKRRYANFTDEQIRELEADSIADIFIFLMNLCTSRRLDAATLFLATIDEVTRKRDWVARPESGT
jgi:uncharacterized secreted protein with C-terminal beta-propeller domain